MAIKYSFIDSVIYGTEDINDITACLTGAGIAPFLSKGSYNVSDLNAMTSALIEEGTSLDGCRCSVENIATSEMGVAVSQGIVFFESGARLCVDEGGYFVKVQPNTEGYIFAHFSPALQKADIVFDINLPTDGEYVLLARLEADGKLKDERIFARSKVATLGKNVTLNTEFEKITPEFLGIEEYNYVYIVAKAPYVDLSRFNYALVFSPGMNTYGIINLSNKNNKVSLGQAYTYGPISYAQVIENRLCVKQEGEENEVPYIPGLENMLSTCKIILV